MEMIINHVLWSLTSLMTRLYKDSWTATSFAVDFRTEALPNTHTVWSLYLNSFIAFRETLETGHRMLPEHVR